LSYTPPKAGHRNHKVYQITDKSLCLKCSCFGLCTKAKYGRRIRRLVHEDLKLKLEHQYNKEPSQAIYKLRKEKVELEESYDILLDT
jgi:hypothetical protein